MGGFGSGKGFRYGFKRGGGRSRFYITEVPYLDYREIDPREIDINEPYAKLRCFDGIAYFRMIPHYLRGGNIWYSFACSCGRGARRLYFRDKILACRKCHKLAYPSENRGKTDRAIDQKWKYLNKLGPNVNLDLPFKPKWKKRRPFEKFIKKAEKYDRLSWARFFRCGINQDPYPLMDAFFAKFF